MSGSISVPVPSLGLSLITNVAAPFIAGTGIPGDLVHIYSPPGGGGGGAAEYVTGNGTFQSVVDNPYQGEYSYYAVQSFFLNNSPPSPTIQLLYVGSVNPPNATVTLSETSSQLAAMFPQGYTFQMYGNVNYVSLTDASYSVSPFTPEAQIQRLYEGLLGRGVDATGLAVNDAYLSQQGSPALTGARQAQVAQSLLTSAEYSSLQGPLNNAQFVSSLYEGFLGRAPDSLGGALLTNALNAGTETRAEAAANMGSTIEAQIYLQPTTAKILVPNVPTSAANAVYETALGRAVDAGTATNIGAALNAGVPLLAIVQNVVASAEYQNDHIGQSPAALVASFYENALGRMPDAVGGPADVAMLNAGVPQAQIILGIATSAEAAAHLTAPFPA